MTFLRKCSGRVAAGVVLVVALGMAVAATSSGGDEPKPAATESARRADILPGPDRLLPGPANSVDDLILLERSSRSLPPIKASADEPTIARITARRLELTHYNQQKFDDAVSARFLEPYLESLDNLRLHFLQSDVAEFERYRDRLDDLTRRGDTTPD